MCPNRLATAAMVHHIVLVSSMYSVMLQVSIAGQTDLESPEWKSVEGEIEEITGVAIADCGRGMFSCDEADGGNVSRDFFFDRISWQKSQGIKRFCEQKGCGIKIRETVTVHPAYSMECPKCGCEQMVEDGKPAMPCMTLPEIVTCQNCGAMFHPVKWQGAE